MADKLQQILNLVDEYVTEREENKSWIPGQDWVSYSGPVYDRDEYRAAIEVLLSGWLIFGKNARDFEILFPKHMGKMHGSLTNSGSSANLLMVAATKSRRFPKRLNDGDKVITPVVCFPTTINPIIQNNLQPVFVDVEMPSLNPDLDKVEAALKADPDIK